MSEALNKFHSIVDSSLGDKAYRTQLCLLIKEHPEFIIPYLEVLENFECTYNRTDYARYLKLTYNNLVPTFESSKNFLIILQSATYEELHSYKYLLERIRPLARRNFGQLFKLKRAKLQVEEQLKISEPLDPKEHLVLIEGNVDTTSFKKEIRESEIFWYADTSRQRVLLHHLNTQQLLLRKVTNFSEIPVLTDGKNESELTEFSKYFPETLSFVNEFAEKMNCGLGRVALVRLSAGNIAYRHADHEIYLKGRNRYHLIVDSREPNILFAGSDYAYIKEGQLWGYGNKKMHKSYNESNTWRVNLIVDMIPPDLHSKAISSLPN